MSYNLAPFFPLYGPNAGKGRGTLIASLTITGAATVANGTLPGNVDTYNGQQQIQIANKTTSWAHINFGQDINNLTNATVAAGYPVAPGSVVIVSVASEVSAVSVILDVAPGTNTAVIFTRGIGT